MRSWGPDNSVHWIPYDPGTYTLNGAVRDPQTGEMDQAQMTFTVNPDSAAMATPQVNESGHPMAAVYSAACASGKMRVVYYPADQSLAQAHSTPFKPCRPDSNLAFVVAGMRADTDYMLANEVVDGMDSQVSLIVPYHSGIVPPDIQIAPIAVRSPRTRAGSATEQVVLQSFIGGSPQAVAFDNQGNPIWYYYDPEFPNVLLFRPIAGGTMILVSSDAKVMREIDLAGNVIREITIEDAAQQVKALGLPPVLGFSHDAVRLPDGNTAVITSIEQLADQGTGVQDVDGDMILVLDRNWQVIWTWNPFEKFDVKRKAILNEVGSGPGATLMAVANDWMHSNSLTYTDDHNLMLSMRHQDWIVKIDYNDGNGTGNVVWRLGAGGDFTTDSTDPYPWFSHQHDATLTNGILTVFDNGNTSVARLGPGNSRGQVWAIDEIARTAHPLLNADVGTYSFALGSARKLGNGDYSFLSGIILGRSFQSEDTEFAPDSVAGTLNFQYTSPSVAYRSFRMKDLYTPE